MLLRNDRAQRLERFLIDWIQSSMAFSFLFSRIKQENIEKKT